MFYVLFFSRASDDLAPMPTKTKIFPISSSKQCVDIFPASSSSIDYKHIRAIVKEELEKEREKTKEMLTKFFGKRITFMILSVQVYWTSNWTTHLTHPELNSTF